MYTHVYACVCVFAWVKVHTCVGVCMDVCMGKLEVKLRSFVLMHHRLYCFETESLH